MASVADPEPIRVLPESALGLALRDAAEAGRPIIVDTGEARYEIEVLAAAPPERDPERAARTIEAIRRAKGAWRDNVDADAFTKYIYERRLTANRPSREL